MVALGSFLQIFSIIFISNPFFEKNLGTPTIALLEPTSTLLEFFVGWRKRFRFWFDHN
jgi:hypothetical protein